MDRTAMSVAAVLGILLLAGCSGVTGGDANATATPDATATATPAPTPSEPGGNPDRAPPDFEVRNVTVSENPVEVGPSVTVTATVENVGDAAAEQTVIFRANGQDATQQSTALGAGEETTVSYSVDTTDAGVGNYTLIVASEDDTAETAFRIRPNEAYEDFFETVREQSLSVGQTTIVDNSTVIIAFSNNTQYQSAYEGQENRHPTPQAAALQMAESPEETPDTVMLAIIDNGSPVWGTNLTQSLAERYANGSANPVEFRRTLTDRAVGPWADRSQYELGYYLTWTRGDRARTAYIEEIATRVQNSTYSDAYTVTDYGLENGTFLPPGTTQTIGPNESIYIELQVPRGDPTYQYRNMISTTLGPAIQEPTWKLGNVTSLPRYGEVPQLLYIRLVDEDGVRYSRTIMPTNWAQNAVSENDDTTVVDAFTWAYSSEKLTTLYDENGEPYDQ